MQELITEEGKIQTDSAPSPAISLYFRASTLHKTAEGGFCYELFSFFPAVVPGEPRQSVPVQLCVSTAVKHKPSGIFILRENHFELNVEYKRGGAQGNLARDSTCS